MSPGGSRPVSREAWSDKQLVDECLTGNEQAWHALIDKYKNLIYSIPVKYGISRDGANEIFQQVCLRLVSELPSLRDPESLPAWLIKVTSHMCFHWARSELRYQPIATGEESEPSGLAAARPAETLLMEVEQEQILREALIELSPRCQELIRMLFFENPAIPYEEAAKTLGLAKGSIGFIRMRCLKRLRQLLEKRGFR